MNCQRCNGLMYRMELKDAKGFSSVRADVCVLCGEMLDPVIAVNRTRNMGRELRRPKRAPRHRRYLNERGFLAVR
jgi:hypothetical protein